MILRPSVILIAAGLVSACVHKSAINDLGERYCEAVIDNDEGAAEILMTDSLRSLIAQARAANAAFQREHPGEKPPLGDGLPLAAFPDRPVSCRIAGATSTGFMIEYHLPGEEGNWVDELVVRREDSGVTQIDDVRFAPERRKTLREGLAQSLRDGP